MTDISYFFLHLKLDDEFQLSCSKQESSDQNLMKFDERNKKFGEKTWTKNLAALLEKNLAPGKMDDSTKKFETMAAKKLFLFQVLQF